MAERHRCNMLKLKEDRPQICPVSSRTDFVFMDPSRSSSSTSIGFAFPLRCPDNCMIKARNYFNPTVSYLVLGDTNEYTWVIAAAKSVFDPLAHEQAK